MPRVLLGDALADRGPQALDAALGDVQDTEARAAVAVVTAGNPEPPCSSSRHRAPAAAGFLGSSAGRRYAVGGERERAV